MYSPKTTEMKAIGGKVRKYLSRCGHSQGDFHNTPKSSSLLESRTYLQKMASSMTPKEGDKGTAEGPEPPHTHEKR